VEGVTEGVCDCVGVCGDVCGFIDDGEMGVEGESGVPFKRKEDGGRVPPDPVWKRRRERYGLPLPFGLTLILLVLPLTPKYWIPVICDGVSDASETSLRM